MELAIFKQIVQKIDDKIRQLEHVRADTRIKYVTLYDHLYLTAGISVAMVEELFQRGKTAYRIVGTEIGKDEVKYLGLIAGLLHDYGKKTGDYKRHVQKTIEIIEQEQLLSELNDKYAKIIKEAIKKHHIKNNPETIFEKVICLADSYASGADREEMERDRRKNFEEWFRLIKVTCDLEKEIFGNEKPLALILGDVDNVKEFVFETSKLPEIRGGSEILNELNTTGIEEIFKTQGLVKECIIYNGGGSFLAIAPVSLAKKIKKEIEKIYLEETKISTITCVCSEPIGYVEFCSGFPPYTEDLFRKIKPKGYAKWLFESYFFKDCIKKKNFSEIVSSLSSDLRRKKMEKVYIPFEPALPIMKRCEHCGKRGAVKYVKHEEEEICRICTLKRKEGNKYRFFDKYANWLENKTGEKAKILKEKKEEIPKTLEDFKGYIAFIYADGNNIGELLETATSPASYRHISYSLKKGTENAVYEALYETTGVELAFEIVNIGGDDVTLFISSQYAWEFAIRFLENFERNMLELAKELDKEKITASIGMLVAKPKYPVYYMEKLAMDLLKLAKQKADSESAICHLYLTSHLAEESAKRIIQDIYIKKDTLTYSLTMRPYGLKQAKKLWEIKGKFEKIYPRAQRYAFVEALNKGVFESVNFLRYQTAREGSKAIVFLKELAEEFNLNNTCWCVNPDFKKLPLFKDIVFATPIVDIIELIEFTKKGKRGGGT